MELVKLTTCWNQVEAEIIKGALASAGIDCIIQGAVASNIRIGNGFGNSAFEIPILVRAEDLDDAKQVINNN